MEPGHNTAKPGLTAVKTELDQARLLVRLGTGDRVIARQGKAAVTAVTVAEGSEEGGNDSVQRQ